MEWLKDKKNLPIVAGLGVVVLILALVAVLFETGVIGGQAGPTEVVSAPPGGLPPGYPGGTGYPGGLQGKMAGPSMPAGGMYPGAPSPGGPMMAGASPMTPGAPGTPVAGTPGAASGTPAAKIVANVAKGPDPFNAPRPALPKVNTKQPAIAARSVAPFLNIAQVTPRSQTSTLPGQSPLPQIRITPEESATMRVSGVVQTSTGVHAVLEANGSSQAVQPGDTVAGGTIVSIQSDGLTLRTVDNRNIHVPLGTGPTGGQGGYPSGGYPGPGGYPSGGYPGAGGFPGGGYPGGFGQGGLNNGGGRGPGDE